MMKYQVEIRQHYERSEVLCRDDLLKIGDIVTWESQAAGSTKIKTGSIVGIVPSGRMVSEARLGVYIPGYKPGTFVLCFDGGVRHEESYLVAVPGGKTDRARPKLYWPRSKHIFF